MPFKLLRQEVEDSVPTTAFRQSHAVVIGINDYTNGIPRLSSAVNDANRLSALLREHHHYQVETLVEGVTYARIKGLLTERLPTLLDEDDRLLFYFAGHGVAEDGEDGPQGFLLPQDARNRAPTTFLPMVALNQWLSALPCRHVLVILDCCFAGAFRWSSTRATAAPWQVVHRERYQRFIRDRAWQVISSTAHDQQASDVVTGGALGERLTLERHSPFATALFEALLGAADFGPNGEKDGLITATDLYIYLRDKVDTWLPTDLLGLRQTPLMWPLAKHDKGEYVFTTVSPAELQLPPAPPLDPSMSPYRGLQRYDEVDEALFFGRQAEIERLLKLVEQQPLIVVVGASGTGKSSLVRAGLLPLLRKDADHWQILPVVRPGTAPMATLAHILSAADAPDLDPVSGAGQEADEAALLAGLARRIEAAQQSACLHQTATKVLLVIDQLEELISLCDSCQRQVVLAFLAQAIERYRDYLRVVVTVRSDFAPQFADSALAEWWVMERMVISPMTPNELRDAIEKPASLRVLYFDPNALVDEIINEVVQEPLALPLLSFTLDELYRMYLQRRGDNRALTRDDYLQLGGVSGALRRRVEETYTQFDSPHQATMRRILLRMLTLEGGEVARRRVTLDELTYLQDDENVRVTQVLTTLVQARLLAQGSGSGDGSTYIEPVHEAMIHAWTRLRDWIQEEDETLLLQRRLTRSAQEWALAPPAARLGLLWTQDPRLDQVHWLLMDHKEQPTQVTSLWRRLFPKLVLPVEPVTLNQTEVTFVLASLRRRARNLQRAMAITAAVMVALLGLTLFAVQQWNSAVAARNNTLVAESLRLATVAEQGLLRDPLTSLDLSLSVLPQSVQARPYVPRAEYALTQALQVNQLRMQIATEAHAQTQVAFGAQSIAAGGSTLQLIELDGATVMDVAVPYWLTLPLSLTKHNLPVTATEFVDWSPTGDLLTVGRQQAQIWRDNTVSAAFTFGEPWYPTCAVWSPVGDAVAICHDAQVLIWFVNKVQPSTEQRSIVIELPDFVEGVSWSPDGRSLAAYTYAEVFVHAIAEPATAWQLIGEEADLNGIQFYRPDQLFTWGDDGILRLWSTLDGELLAQYEDRETYRHIRGIALSNDGVQLAAYREDGTINVWQLDAPDLQPLQLRGHSGLGVLDVAWHGGYLASAGADEVINVWQISTEQLVTQLSGHAGRVNQVIWHSDGRHLWSHGQDGKIRLWQVFTANGTPLCQLIEAQAHCKTFLQEEITLADGVVDVVWSGSRDVVLTTAQSDVWTWNLAEATVQQAVAVGSADQRTVVDGSGVYAIVYTPQASGVLWQRRVDGWQVRRQIAGPIAQVVWDRDLLAVVEPTDRVRLFHLQDDNEQVVLTAMTDKLWYVGLTNDQLALSYTTGALRIYEIATGEMRFADTGEPSQPYEEFSWLDNGTKLLAMTAQVGAVTLFDLTAGTVLWRYASPDLGLNTMAAVPAPNERYAIVGTDNVLFVLDLQTGTVLAQQSPSDAIFLGAAWLADGTRLITWDTAGALRVWHWESAIPSLTEVLTLYANETLRGAHLSTTGKSVVTAGLAGTVQVWQLWPSVTALLEEINGCCDFE